MTTSMAGSSSGGGAAVAQCIRDGMLLRSNSREALGLTSSQALAHPPPQSCSAKEVEKGRIPAARGRLGPFSTSSPPQVLIVSADPGRRAVLAALLRSCATAAGLAESPKAQIAPDGKTARSALTRCPTDLVFVDVELLDVDWLPLVSLTPSTASEAGEAAHDIMGRPFVVVMSLNRARDPQGDTVEGSSGEDNGGLWRRFDAVVERPVTRDAVRLVLSEYLGIRRCAAAGSQWCGGETLLQPPVAPILQVQTDVLSTAQACSPLAAVAKPYAAKILIVEGGVQLRVFTLTVPVPTLLPLG